MRINKYHIQVLVVEAVAVIFASFITFVVAWARTLPQQSRAQAFLQVVTKLKVGKSTYNEAELIATRYGGMPWWSSDGTMRCTREECVFRFVFENKPLTSTHLVPYTVFIGMISVKKDTVVSLFLHYSRTEGKKEIAYNVIDTLPGTTEGQSLRGLVRMNVDREGIPWAVSVYMDPSSDADQRSRAYALNLSCLAKVFGCARASSIFPAGIPYRGSRYQTNSATW